MGDSNWLMDLFNQADGYNDDVAAQGYRQKALGSVSGLKAPTLDPIAAQQETGNAYDGIQRDQGSMDAQRQALNQLMAAGNGGYGIEDRAALNNAMGEANQQVRGQNAAALQQMQARGQGGSGFALQAQLAGGQQQANAAASAGMNAAASARSRALQALQAGGQMAGQMRGQTFDEGAKRAQAQNDINARNAAMRQNANMYNSGLQQQGWQDQAQVAGMQNGAYNTAAGQYADDAEKKRKQIQQFGQSISQGGQAVAKGLAGGL